MGVIKKIIEKYIDKNYKTIDDLPSNVLMELNDKKMIESTKILIIDDDQLEIKDTLNRIGYNVVWKNDIDLLSDVEDYPIIICDNKGVGSKFSSEFEGLNLIKLIKEKYPDKIIYLLSAADINPKANNYIKYADEMVYKGEEDKLIEYIKQDLNKLFNPRDRWLQYKSIIKNKGISEKEIFRLENLYVESFIQKRDILSKDTLFSSINDNLGIKFDVKVGLINL